jgi:hypothetical protein
MSDFAEFYNAVCNAEGRVGVLALVVKHPTRREYIAPPPGLSARQVRMLADAAVTVGRQAPRLRCVACPTTLRGPSDTLILCSAAPGRPDQWVAGLACWACSTCGARQDLLMQVNKYIERAGRRLSASCSAPGTPAA